MKMPFRKARIPFRSDGAMSERGREKHHFIDFLQKKTPEQQEEGNFHLRDQHFCNKIISFTHKTGKSRAGVGMTMYMICFVDKNLHSPATSPSRWRPFPICKEISRRQPQPMRSHRAIEECVFPGAVQTAPKPIPPLFSVTLNCLFQLEIHSQ